MFKLRYLRRDKKKSRKSRNRNSTRNSNRSRNSSVLNFSQDNSSVSNVDLVSISVSSPEPAVFIIPKVANEINQITEVETNKETNINENTENHNNADPLVQPISFAVPKHVSCEKPATESVLNFCDDSCVASTPFQKKNKNLFNYSNCLSPIRQNSKNLLHKSPEKSHQKKEKIITKTFLNEISINSRIPKKRKTEVSLAKKIFLKSKNLADNNRNNIKHLQKFGEVDEAVPSTSGIKVVSICNKESVKNQGDLQHFKQLVKVTKAGNVSQNLLGSSKKFQQSGASGNRNSTECKILKNLVRDSNNLQQSMQLANDVQNLPSASSALQLNSCNFLETQDLPLTLKISQLGKQSSKTVKVQNLTSNKQNSTSNNDETLLSVPINIQQSEQSNESCNLQNLPNTLKNIQAVQYSKQKSNLSDIQTLPSGSKSFQQFKKLSKCDSKLVDDQQNLPSVNLQQISRSLEQNLEVYNDTQKLPNLSPISSDPLVNADVGDICEDNSNLWDSHGKTHTQIGKSRKKAVPTEKAINNTTSHTKILNSSSLKIVKNAFPNTIEINKEGVGNVTKVIMPNTVINKNSVSNENTTQLNIEKCQEQHFQKMQNKSKVIKPSGNVKEIRNITIFDETNVNTQIQETITCEDIKEKSKEIDEIVIPYTSKLNTNYIKENGIDAKLHQTKNILIRHKRQTKSKRITSVNLQAGIENNINCEQSQNKTYQRKLYRDSDVLKSVNEQNYESKHVETDDANATNSNRIHRLRELLNVSDSLVEKGPDTTENFPDIIISQELVRTELVQNNEAVLKSGSTSISHHLKTTQATPNADSNINVDFNAIIHKSNTNADSVTLRKSTRLSIQQKCNSSQNIESEKKNNNIKSTNMQNTCRRKKKIADTHCVSSDLKRESRVRIKTVPYWLPQCRVQYGFAENGTLEVKKASDQAILIEKEDIIKKKKSPKKNKTKSTKRKITQADKKIISNSIQGSMDKKKMKKTNNSGGKLDAHTFQPVVVLKALETTNFSEKETVEASAKEIANNNDIENSNLDNVIHEQIITEKTVNHTANNNTSNNYILKNVTRLQNSFIDNASSENDFIDLPSSSGIVNNNQPENNSNPTKKSCNNHKANKNKNKNKKNLKQQNKTIANVSDEIPVVPNISIVNENITDNGLRNVMRLQNSFIDNGSSKNDFIDIPSSSGIFNNKQPDNNSNPIKKSRNNHKANKNKNKNKKSLKQQNKTIANVSDEIPVVPSISIVNENITDNDNITQQNNQVFQETSKTNQISNEMFKDQGQNSNIVIQNLKDKNSTHIEDNRSQPSEAPHVVHITNTKGLGLAINLSGELIECFSRDDNYLEYKMGPGNISRAIKLQTPSLKCLYVKIPPHGDKLMSSANKNNLMFTVMKGSVRVTILSLQKDCNERDIFYVPVGIQYRIQNLTDDEVLLLLVRFS